MSKDGRVTLVITPKAKAVPVLWAELSAESLDEAVGLLQEREGCVPRRIGVWPSVGEVVTDSYDVIDQWAKARGCEGVVWTALPPKWRVDGQVPSVAEIIDHLERLQPEARSRAAEYIRRAPDQIETEYRSELSDVVSRLGAS